MKKLTSKEIRAQLKWDMIGKDAFRGVTFSYSYLCNQFGHFSLGFLIGLFALKLGSKLGWFSQSAEAVLISAGFSAGLVLAFEIYNYTDSIYLKPKREKKDFPFKKDSNNLLRDLCVDLLFFWIGAMSFYLLFTPIFNWEALEIFIVMFIVTFFFWGRSWYIRKIYQQQAFFPFSLRLAEIEGPVEKKMVEQIQAFSDSKEEQVHLLLYGDEKHENNELAVALGNEFAIDHQKVTYTTFMSFLRMCHESHDELMDYNGSRGFWSWRETKYLVIDHMLSGGEVKAISYEPHQLIEEINNPIYGTENVNALVRQNVIWVVGDIPNRLKKEAYKKKWRDFLMELGVAENKIQEIDLDDGN